VIETLDSCKNTRLQNIDWSSKVIQCKLAVKAKGKLTHNENGQKMRCNANKDICAIHCKPETKKTEKAATLVFVVQVTEAFDRLPQ